MPITDVQFDNGIFFAREVDYITGDDAHNWARVLGHYAANSPMPIVAMVDAREVTAISNDARRVFAMASETSNVRAAVVVVNQINRLATQQSRITALRPSKGGEALYAFAASRKRGGMGLAARIDPGTGEADQPVEFAFSPVAAEIAGDYAVVVLPGGLRAVDLKDGASKEWGLLGPWTVRASPDGKRLYAMPALGEVAVDALVTPAKVADKLPWPEDLRLRAPRPPRR